MTNVLRFPQPIGMNHPTDTEFDLTRLRFIASLAERLSMIIVNCPAGSEVCVAELVAMGKVAIAELTRIEPVGEERRSVEDRLRRSISAC